VGLGSEVIPNKPISVSIPTQSSRSLLEEKHVDRILALPTQAITLPRAVFFVVIIASAKGKLPHRLKVFVPTLA
jgi:hypothetical protein